MADPRSTDHRESARKARELPPPPRGSAPLAPRKGKSPLPISFDVSYPGATNFCTRTPIAWADFQFADAYLIQGGFSAGGGYSWGWVQLGSLTTRPLDISVSSVSAGIPGITLAQRTFLGRLLMQNAD